LIHGIQNACQVQNVVFQFWCATLSRSNSQGTNPPPSALQLRSTKELTMKGILAWVIGIPIPIIIILYLLDVF
jgi:hypothetical protein